MTQIELTPQEVGIIQAAREAEAAKALEVQQRIDNEITLAEARIQKRQADDAAQRTAALAFLKELGAEWVEEFTPSTKKEIVRWDSKLIRTIDYQGHTSLLRNGEYTVVVHRHVVYDSKWSSCSTDKGFKMFLSGPSIEYAYGRKALAKADTVNKKVAECRDDIVSAAELKIKKASAVDTAVADLRAKYPTATVTAEKSYRKMGNGYRDYDQVTIQLTNGIKATYEVYPSGSLQRLNVTFGKIDTDVLLDVLSSLELPTT